MLRRVRDADELAAQIAALQRQLAVAENLVRTVSCCMRALAYASKFPSHVSHFPAAARHAGEAAQAGERGRYQAACGGDQAARGGGSGPRRAARRRAPPHGPHGGRRACRGRHGAGPSSLSLCLFLFVSFSHTLPLCSHSIPATQYDVPDRAHVSALPLRRHSRRSPQRRPRTATAGRSGTPRRTP